jgi:hypothetical protein
VGSEAAVRCINLQAADRAERKLKILKNRLVAGIAK